MEINKKINNFEAAKAVSELPDMVWAPMCDRCIPFGRCQGLSQIEYEDWAVLEECFAAGDLGSDVWNNIQKKYSYLELDRLKLGTESLAVLSTKVL